MDTFFNVAAYFIVYGMGFLSCDVFFNHQNVLRQLLGRAPIPVESTVQTDTKTDTPPDAPKSSVTGKAFVFDPTKRYMYKGQGKMIEVNPDDLKEPSTVADLLSKGEIVEIKADRDAASLAPVPHSGDTENLSAAQLKSIRASAHGQKEVEALATLTPDDMRDPKKIGEILKTAEKLSKDQRQILNQSTSD